MDKILGREWMYERKHPTGEFNRDFIDGLDMFMNFAMSFPSKMDGSKIRCPCKHCDNSKFFSTDTVKEHLVRRGFTPNYYDWRFHCDVEASSSSIPGEPMHFDPSSDPYQHMVHNVWGQTAIHEPFISRRNIPNNMSRLLTCQNPPLMSRNSSIIY